MKWLKGICAVLVVAALVLTGCLGVKTPQVPAPATPTLLVDYQRTGGIAGVNDRLVIFDNGAGLVQSQETSREIGINQSDLEEIPALFEAAKYMLLEENYTSGRGGADRLQYRISYKGKTVNTEELAIPPALEPVIQELDRILADGLKSGQADLQLPRIVT